MFHNDMFVASATDTALRVKIFYSTYPLFIKACYSFSYLMLMVPCKCFYCITSGFQNTGSTPHRVNLVFFFNLHVYQIKLVLK